MKILHVITGLRRTAGTTVFAIELSRAQVAAGHEVKIAVHNIADSVAPDGVEFLELYDINNFSFEPDIVHIHALWSIRQVRAMRWCQKKGYRYVVSIHGCLMPRVFAKSPFKKWVFYWLLLKANIKKASAIHCTSEYEKHVCEDLGFNGPFVVAPLGIEMPDDNHRERGGCPRTVLFMGRLGEEKGLINLLDVWKSLPREMWRLVLAGPDWLGYKKVLDEKIAKDGIDGVVFTGAVYGEKKDSLYRSADIFVLPSPTENFSMVVLEALAYGVPAIATKGTPWAELESCKCGWWIDQGVDALRAALRGAMSLSDDDRACIGNHGKTLAKDKYSWTSISKTILSAYNLPFHGGTKSKFVYTSEV